MKNASECLHIFSRLIKTALGARWAINRRLARLMTVIKAGKRRTPEGKRQGEGGEGQGRKRGRWIRTRWRRKPGGKEGRGKQGGKEERWSSRGLRRKEGRRDRQREEMMRRGRERRENWDVEGKERVGKIR